MTAIPVTSSAGVHLTGLIPGLVYGISTSGGPWLREATTIHYPATYIWQASIDGANWGSTIGRAGDPGGAQDESYVPSWADQRVELGTYYTEILFTATTSDLYVRVGPDSPYSDNTGSLDCTLIRYDTYCAWGTEKRADAPLVVFVTGGLIALAVELTGGSAAISIAFGMLIGTPLYVEQLCDINPPPLPTFTEDDFTFTGFTFSPSGYQKALRALGVGLWLIYCQCTEEPPGETPPVLPPQPVFPPTGPSGPGGPTFPPGPGGGGNPPPVECDSTSVCTILDRIQRQLNGQSQVLLNVWNDVQLIQRQKVPFGYVAGAVHADLSGNGHFAVSGLIGVSVELGTIPPTHPALGGDPETYHQLGKVSLGTPDGWLRSFMPTHNPYLIFPIEGAVTRIGYALSDGVVATITELVREP